MLHLRDFVKRHRSIRVLYLRLRHGCGHLGNAVNFCYCDPNRARHWRENPSKWEENP